MQPWPNRTRPVKARVGASVKPLETAAIHAFAKIVVRQTETATQPPFSEKVSAARYFNAETARATTKN
jgi:hypothetical protein